MADLQIFDGRFMQQDTGSVYQNIINCIPTKPPYLNNSYREIFTQNITETWDKQIFFIRKRWGFNRVPSFSWNQWETSLVEDSNDWIFTDMQLLDWYRYFLATNIERTKIRVYKQINVAVDEYYSYPISAGNIVNISKYSYTNQSGWQTELDYFPFNKDCYDKFIKTTHVKWPIKHESQNGIAKLKQIWSQGFSYLTTESGEVINTEPGDWIYIDWFDVPMQWQVVNVSKPKYNQTNDILIFDSWLWAVLKDTWENEYTWVHFKVFGEYWPSLHFATSDGIIHHHYDEGKPSTADYSVCPDTFVNTFDNAKKPKRLISSIDMAFRTGMAYFDYYNSFVYFWLEGKNKFYFNPLNSTPVAGDYKHIKQFQDFFMLLWPSNIWYMVWSISSGQWQLSEVLLSENNWYFTDTSFQNYNENFYLVRNNKKFSGLWLQPYGNAVKPIFTLLSTFLWTDLDMLKREEFDNVNLCVDWDDIKIFLTNRNWDTKVMIFDPYYQLRYRWIVEDSEIMWVEDWVYYGRWVFEYGWAMDWNKHIKQVVTMTFGDLSQNVVKYLGLVKCPIGYNSHITANNTRFIFRFDNGWWQQTYTENNIARVDYINNIMVPKLWWTFKTYPIDIQLKWSTGVDVNKQTHKLQTEIDEYKQYSPVQTPEGEYQISKYASIEFPLAEYAELVTMEVICDGWDSIEFWWFFVWYSFWDADNTRPENVVTDLVLEPDSWLRMRTNSHHTDIVLNNTP